VAEGFTRKPISLRLIEILWEGIIMTTEEQYDQHQLWNPDMVLYEKKDHIATITLNRPEVLNAFLTESFQEIANHMDSANEDDDVRVLVVTGKGRGFSSGDDVKGMFLAPKEVREAKRWARSLRTMDKAAHNETANAFMRFDKPSIAMVNGVAVGWGMELALWCDMRIASDRARFTELFAVVGLIPSAAGLHLLPFIVGLPKAYELLYTGRFVEAQEALEIGLVNKLVPHEQLEEETYKFAAQIATGAAPVSHKLIKEIVKRGFYGYQPQASEYIRIGQTLAGQTEDHHNYSVSFAQKKGAVTYKGR
jgi:2-(1,2-epoxy-1,2-dihydrophenyl)acetyl-CoA isomerase